VRRAAVGSAAFFLVAPCVVGGLVPWLITDWDDNCMWLPARVLGFALIAVGAAALLHSFARFVREGIGTPAPVAPTERLVVGGLYRYVRNPMYVALAAVILGQALALGRWSLVLYGAVVMTAVVSFVRLYEEPALTRQFGARYAEYRAAVPGWLPRLRPWEPPRGVKR
jgi:protein-S-isoprenylcysteine O-methyltransferase Ste14